MIRYALLRLVLSLSVGFLLLAAGRVLPSRFAKEGNLLRSVLVLLSAIGVATLIFLAFNHLPFPLHLEVMEGNVLQHLQRAASFQSIYPEPSPEYVPLAYNPLYYILAVPFSWIFGVNLFTLRLVSTIAACGTGAVIYLATLRYTRSKAWGFIALGLFATSYRVLDAYYDTAHSDMWMVFSALLGTYLIDSAPSRRRELCGIVLLVCSFWFKQHGALFTCGGLVYLTFRNGVRGSIRYWVLAGALGPAVYLFAGPALFGPQFHHFTFHVPTAWTQLDLGVVRRYVRFVILHYSILACAVAASLCVLSIRCPDRLGIWHLQFVFASFSGLMGSMDIGSSDNVYMPFSLWVVVLGVFSIWDLSLLFPPLRQKHLQHLALLASFGLLSYNPVKLVVPMDARHTYEDLISDLEDLDGSVYAPSIGQLEDDYKFHPAAHWVALEDMIRGPGRNTRNHANTRRLLAPALHPSATAYVLANVPLAQYPWLAFLEESYELERDFGDRFRSLRILPARWDHGWPRYLYRHRRSP